MIEIRDEQLTALSIGDASGLEARLRAALAERYPDELAALGRDGAPAFVRRGAVAGIAAGLDTEGALERLLALMVQLGEQFERSPDRARGLAFLHHPTLPSELKIQLVEKAVTARTGGRVVVRHAPNGG